jgi:predicted  nucleic acid-binding Zn-ribbon protein
MKDLEREIIDFKEKYQACEYKVTCEEGFLYFYAYRKESDEEYKARLEEERIKEEEEARHRNDVNNRLEETMIKKILTRGLVAVAVCSCYSCGHEKLLIENEVVEDCINCGSTKFQIKTKIIGSEK